MKNELFSNKNFTNMLFISINPALLNNTTITGSCFYQETNNFTKIFPDNIENVILEDCNFDNCLLQEGIILDNTTNKQIKYNLESYADYIIDEEYNFISALRE